jgi:hypothetical protein
MPSARQLLQETLGNTAKAALGGPIFKWDYPQGGFMETNELIIKPLKFNLRMGKYALIPRLIHNVDQIVDIKGKILNLKMSGFERIFTELIDRGIASALGVSLLRGKAEQNEREDIEEYLPILFNQALVMMVTTFDVFLVDSLEVMTRKQPNILHQLAIQTDISIKDVVNTTDYETIFDTILKRALWRFDHRKIEEKIKVLKDVALDTDGIFNFKFQGDATRNKFPDSYKNLVAVYNNRHGIVHRDELPIKTPEELDTITELFSNLIMSFAWEMSERFDIKTDFHLPESANESQTQPAPKT